MKITADTLTDAQIRALQDEAEHRNDVEYIRLCLRAYRGGGCAANPHARAQLAALLDERRRPVMEHALFELAIKLVIAQEGKILLLRRPGIVGSFWDLPGGRLAPFEHFDTAIARELREELGCTAKPVATQLLDVGMWRHPGVCPKILHYYHAYFEGRVNVTISVEHEGHTWVVPQEAALDALDEARLEPTLREILLRFSPASVAEDSDPRVLVGDRGGV